MKKVTVRVDKEVYEKLSKRAEVHNISVPEYVKSLIDREVGTDSFDYVTLDLMFKDAYLNRARADIESLRKVSDKMSDVLDKIEDQLKKCSTE